MSLIFFMAQVPHLRVQEEGLYRVIGFVGRSIIDDQYLNISIRLVENALDTPPNDMCPVVRGYDYTYLRQADLSYFVK
jgi:hypothetical protein